MRGGSTEGLGEVERGDLGSDVLQTDRQTSKNQKHGHNQVITRQKLGRNLCPIVKIIL